jgi:hypothetical protein
MKRRIVRRLRIRDPVGDENTSKEDAGPELFYMFEKRERFSINDNCGSVTVMLLCCLMILIFVLVLLVVVASLVRVCLWTAWRPTDLPPPPRVG